MRMIDADALIDNICKYAAPEMVWDRVDIIHKINEMPTIEERNGKWLPDNTNPYAIMFICSECKESVCSQVTSSYKPIWKYCPNCSAKMEGVQP